MTRFVDNGTITDGLTWLKNANALGRLTWNRAVTVYANLCDGLADSSRPGDWMVASIKSLLSLVDYDQVNPALPPGLPAVNVQPYWTSTSFRENLDYAWYVNLGHVDRYDKAFAYYVWPVKNPVR